MRVKISANPPLPPVRAWFPLPHPSHHGQTIASFKTILCNSLPAFCDLSPSSLHLSIDSFELLDGSELTVVRDGDLISVDIRDVSSEVGTAHSRLEQGQMVDADHSASYVTRLRREPAPASSRKRKRRPSTPSPSSSGSESDTEESSTTSESESEPESSSDDASASSLQKARPVSVHANQAVPSVQPKPKPPAPLKTQSSTFVPPGYGKPQTRTRNLRRRIRRVHDREAADASGAGPVSGANAVEPGHNNGDTQVAPSFMSLSLRNKNKAKNFKSLMNRPLPSKIIFGGEEDVSTGGAPAATIQTQDPRRFISPSMRSSLPPNLFVTSVDVEADLHREKKTRPKYEAEPEEEVLLDYGEGEEDIDKLESMANKQWDILEKPTRREVAEGTLVGYKALGIDPVTYTPGQVLTVGRVESCDEDGLVVRPFRAVSFNWQGEAELEEHSWEEIDRGNWRVLR